MNWERKLVAASRVKRSETKLANSMYVRNAKERLTARVEPIKRLFSPRSADGSGQMYAKFSRASMASARMASYLRKNGSRLRHLLVSCGEGIERIGYQRFRVLPNASARSAAVA